MTYCDGLVGARRTINTTSTCSTRWFSSAQAHYQSGRAYNKLDKAVARWQSWDVIEALLHCGEVEKLLTAIVDEFSLDVSL